MRMNHPVRNDYVTMSDELYQYLLGVSLRETEIQGQLRAEIETGEHARMQLTPEQAQFIAFLVKLTNSRRVIEVGVFKGYSSLALALALPEDGRLIACDVNESWTSVASRYWKRAGVADKVELRIGSAVETLQELVDHGERGSFDFMFVDADKQSYQQYVDLGCKLLREGGLIAIDNVLWDGFVADESNNDPETCAIRALNVALKSDARFDLTLVPIGDGLTLLRKR